MNCLGVLPRGWRTEAEYVSATRSRRPLRFFTGAPEVLEAAWRTRWVSGDLPAQKRARITKAQDPPPDLVVVQPVRDWTCAECQGTGDLLIMDNAGPLRLACADMDHLVFLPSDEAALTRRAKKASALSAVVVRWSRTRKRYERQGLLVSALPGRPRGGDRPAHQPAGKWPGGTFGGWALPR